MTHACQAGMLCWCGVLGHVHARAHPCANKRAFMHILLERAIPSAPPPRAHAVLDDAGWHHAHAHEHADANARAHPVMPAACIHTSVPHSCALPCSQCASTLPHIFTRAHACVLRCSQRARGACVPGDGRHRSGRNGAAHRRRIR
eukprot:358487-Chlamydomonas_euryale.AAC.3